MPDTVLSAVEAVESVETPQESTPLHEQGLSKSDIIARLSGESEYEPETVPPEPEGEETTAGESETPVEAVAPSDSEIPGLEAEKPADAKPAPPEGERDLADVADAPDAGKFRVRGPDGAFVETPDVKIEFTQNGKVYTKDVASIVRLAYDGVAGQRAIAHARTLETQTIPQLQQQSAAQLEAAKAELQAQIDLNYAILSDESGETWAKNHEKLAASRTPEAIAERATRDAEAARQQLQDQQEGMYRQQVFATHVNPVLTRVANECPDVSEDARAGRIAFLTGHLLVNGKIPPSAYPALVSILEGPYAEWSRTEQQKVNESRSSTQKQIDEATKVAQATLREAQKKQNALVAPLKPMGGVPSTTVARPLPPPRNKAEAMERIINRKADF